MSPITLDATKYKTTTVSRGFTYNYYFSPARPGKPTLLFAHGFPSTSADWAGVVGLLESEGYGVVVPDMLGFGGTDRPGEAAMYVGSGIARDLVEVLDAESIEKAVVVGHDWGSLAISRVINTHPERVIAAAFVTVGYVAPYVAASFSDVVKPEASKETSMGYFAFMATQEKLIEQHIDSFMDLIFPEDPGVHLRELIPNGAAMAWVEGDRRCERLASAVATPEWYRARRKLLASGMAAPTCWYKVQISGLAQEDNKGIPKEAYTFDKPVFFGVCTKEGVPPPEQDLKTYAQGTVTRREYDAGHWVILTHYEELGRDLSVWLEGLSEV